MTRYFTANGVVERKPVNDRCEHCQKKQYNLIHNLLWSGSRGHRFIPHFKHRFKLAQVNRAPFMLGTYTFRCLVCDDKHMMPIWTLFNRPPRATIPNLWDHAYDRPFADFDEAFNNIFGPDINKKD